MTKLVSLPKRFRLASNAPVRRVLAIFLMFALCGTVTASAIADDLPSVNTTPIEGKVRRIGLGEHVAVRFTTGQTVRGWITDIGIGSFAITPENGKPSRVIAYSGVTNVKTKRGPLPWVMAGVVIGTVILIAMVHAPPTHVHLR